MTIAAAVKWVSLPVLLIGSIFSCSAASYERLLDCLICLGAIIVVQRTVWAGNYFWAAGFVVVAVVFSPLMLVVKLFLLMGFACVATFLTLLAALKKQPAPVA